MHQLDPLSAQERPQAADPAGPGGPVEAVHRQAGRSQLRDEAVLPRQQVGEPVAEPLPVQVGRAAQQQLLGAAPPQALDQDEDVDHAGPTTSS
jgi:hypothetical protein